MSDVKSPKENSARNTTSRVSSPWYEAGKFDTAMIDSKFSVLKINQPRPSSIYFPERSTIISIATTHDERIAFAGLANGEIRVHSLVDSEEEFECLNGHSADVRHLFVTSDDKYLISGSYDCSIRIWNLETMEEVCALNGHSNKVLSFIATADGSIIYSSSLDGYIKVWKYNGIDDEDMDDWEEDTLVGFRGQAYSLALTKENRYLIIGCADHEIKVYSLFEEKIEAVLRGHEDCVFGVRVTSDGKYVVSCSIDNSIRIWNLQSMKEERLLVEHTSAVYSIALTSDDNYLAFGSGYGTVGLCSLNTKNQEILIDGHNTNSQVRSVHFSKTGHYMFTGSTDENFKIWKISEHPDEKIYEENTTRVNDVAVSPGSNFLASVSEADNRLLVWKDWDKEDILDIDGLTGSIHCVIFTNDNEKCITGSSDSTIRILSLRDESEILYFDDHESGVISLCISSDDRILASASMDMSVCLYDLRQNQRIKKFLGHKSGVMCVVMTPDDTQVISGSQDKTIRICSIDESEDPFVFCGHDDTVSSLAVTSEGKTLISGSHDQTVRLWDLEYKTPIITLKRQAKPINKICMTRDNLYFYTLAGSKTVKLWSLTDKLELGTVLSKQKIKSMAISPDSKKIAITSDNRIHVFESPIACEKSAYSVLPFNYSFLTKYFIYRLLNNTPVDLDPNLYNFTICPWDITVLHVLSFMSNSKYLKKAIKMGAKFMKCVTGETPLSISLSRKSKLCAEIIIKRFPTYLLLYNPSIYSYLEGSLHILNKSSLPSLHVLYDSAFPQVENQTLPTFGKFTNKPPIVKSSTISTIDPSDFLDKQEDEMEILQESEVEFRQSALKLDLEAGSQESIDFMRSLSTCQNSEVFRTEFVNSILKFKWKQIMWMMWAQALVYLLLILLLFVHTVGFRDNSFILGLIMLLNTTFLMYEVLQSIAGVSMYFKDLWNTLDISRILLLYIYPVCVIAGADSYTLDVMLSLVTVIAWIRIVGYIRMFDRTRYLIHMIIEVMKDMGPFLLIFIMSTFAFCIAFYAASSNEEDFIDMVKHSYNLTYGEYDNENYNNLELFIFFVASLFNALLLLNLLIAIMGDTYDRVRNALDVADRREMADIIVEADSIMFWGRRKGSFKYLQQCNVAESRSKDIDEWEGKTRTILRSLNSLDRRSKINEIKLDEIKEDFERSKGSKKGSSENEEFLREIMQEVLSLKREMRGQMMQVKLDVAAVRNEIHNSFKNKL